MEEAAARKGGKKTERMFVGTRQSEAPQHGTPGSGRGEDSGSGSSSSAGSGNGDPGNHHGLAGGPRRRRARGHQRWLAQKRVAAAAGQGVGEGTQQRRLPGVWGSDSDLDLNLPRLPTSPWGSFPPAGPGPACIAFTPLGPSLFPSSVGPFYGVRSTAVSAPSSCSVLLPLLSLLLGAR